MRLTLKQRHYLERIFTYTFVILMSLIILIPIFWGFLSSIRPSEELFKWPPVIIPSSVGIENYILLFETTDFLLFFRNSLIVAILAMIITLIIAIPAAYSLSRYEYRGRDFIANSSTLIYMFPLILLGIPLFIIFRNLQLTNSHLGLAIAHSAFSLPFAILLLRVFFSDISPAIEESAQLTGAGRSTIIRHIILPLSLPGIVATVIFTMAVSWNEFFFAFILINDNNLYTLPLGIANLVNLATTNWGLILGGVIIMTIPPVILIFILYKYLIRGFAVGTL